VKSKSGKGKKGEGGQWERERERKRKNINQHTSSFITVGTASTHACMSFSIFLPSKSNFKVKSGGSCLSVPSRTCSAGIFPDPLLGVKPPANL
jgi:hypothetical protein